VYEAGLKALECKQAQALQVILLSSLPNKRGCYKISYMVISASESNNSLPAQEEASSPKMVFSSKDIEHVLEPQSQEILYFFQS
jgi:hypothetical protein